MKETFPLDSMELNLFDCVKWSKDNHVCVASKRIVLICTPPFQGIDGCSLRRSQINVQRQIICAEWSSLPINGYHRLAILTDDGKIHVFAPRMDPSWNVWREEEQLDDVEASCFAWNGVSIVYGTKTGKVHSRNGKKDLEMQQRNGIPVRICCVDKCIVVAWDDGVVECICNNEQTSLITTDIWGVGPMVSFDLFSKTNKLFMDRVCKELPTISPITGLTERYCCTANGNVLDNTTFEALADLQLESTFGLAEIPCKGVHAVAGKSKGHFVLTIFSNQPTPTTDLCIDSQSMLCQRWLHLQYNQPECRSQSPAPHIFDPLLASKCVFCGDLQAKGGVECSQCGAYCFKLMEK